ICPLKDMSLKRAGGNRNSPGVVVATLHCLDISDPTVGGHTAKCESFGGAITAISPKLSCNGRWNSTASLLTRSLAKKWPGSLGRFLDGPGAVLHPSDFRSGSGAAAEPGWPRN